MQFVKTEIGADPIVVEGYFSAPPCDVFRAWTDPDIVMKWFGPRPGSLHAAEIDLRRGGRWRFLETVDTGKTVGFEGEYLAIENDRRLVFTWSKFVARASGERESTPGSQVEIVLTPKGSGTDIRIVHSAIRDEPMRRGFAGGWEQGMINLCAILEKV
ncbi:SRPBCC domain-containing protein [Nitratireductor sp. XY-223]|uniref:SRPBCC family protein n=1 Tax=Nitratireductor sp. XY-223 TaxID=2561926 RepID=UPI001FEEE190|nr:SRPBCC domain-containing protein [Nitratireductor sp. XY-223]